MQLNIENDISIKGDNFALFFYQCYVYEIN
jgi:hypothetical protein